MDESASKSQTYYLFLLTGLDARNCNLGKKECIQLVDLWKSNKQEDRDFVYDFLITKNAIVRRKKRSKKENVSMAQVFFSRKETYDRINGMVNANKNWEDIIGVLNKEKHSTDRIQAGGWTAKNSYDFYRRIMPERPTGVRKIQQERRIEMCKLLNNGKTVKEISAKFKICEMSVRSAIKTALRKHEAVIDSKHSFGKRSGKRVKQKKVEEPVLKTDFPSFAISEMKSVLDSIFDSNMDNNSKLAIIKTILSK